MLETQVGSLGGEGPLEKEVATHCSIPAWRIPWTEERGGGWWWGWGWQPGLQSMGLQLNNKQQQAFSKVRGERDPWLSGMVRGLDPAFPLSLPSFLGSE